MGPDPKPQDPVGGLDANSAIMDADSGRPIAPDFLEVERRVFRVLFEELEGAVRKLLNRSRQRAVGDPEIR
jgi:hypothetical protein